jgi:hypothetical protein
MAEHNQQFNTFQEWVNKGSSWLTRHQRLDSSGCRFNSAVCFDTNQKLPDGLLGVGRQW